MQNLKAPFPWFGGKSAVADAVWKRFGTVKNYVEPFFGSGAVLLKRPDWRPGARLAETVNDADGLLANFWRALQHDPDGVARAADWPVNECVPAGTMIATPAGPVAVEAIRAGMWVLGVVDGRVVSTQVSATKQSTAADFVRIGDLRVTDNHPVWTGGGYVEAAEIRGGEKISRLNWPVYETDLIVVESTDGKTVDHLLAERPENTGRSVRRYHISRGTAAAYRAHFASCARRAHASGLLDSVPHQRRGKADSLPSATRGGGWLAGCGADVDRVLPAGDAHQPHRRRRRYARTLAVSRTAPKVVGDAARREVLTRSCIGDAGQGTLARGGGENPCIINRAAAHPGRTREAFSSTQGQGDLTRGPREDGCGEAGPTACTRAQGQDRGKHPGARRGAVRRDGGALRVNHGGGGGGGGQRGVGVSGHSEGLPLSRVSLGAPVAVYNFQTGTGNYFADSILVHNCDMHARHLWLVGQREALTDRLMGEPEWYDVRAAGWWVWGASAWIGSGWCSGQGPWVEQGGLMVRRDEVGSTAAGVVRQMPEVDHSRGVHTSSVSAILRPVAERLRHVKVACGDWARVSGRSSTGQTGNLRDCAVFLDPPYDEGVGYTGGGGVSGDVWAWACEQGDNPLLRIAVCGYEDGREVPPGWRVLPWATGGGYGNQSEAGEGRANARRERVWFSPACIPCEGDVDCATGKPMRVAGGQIGLGI